MDIFHERSCFFLHRNSLIYLLSLTISQWPNSAFLTWEKAAAQTECVRYPSAKSPAANIDLHMYLHSGTEREHWGAWRKWQFRNPPARNEWVRRASTHTRVPPRSWWVILEKHPPVSTDSTMRLLQRRREREKNSQESHSWPPLERTCSQSFAFRDMCAEEKWHKKFVTPRAALFFMSHTKREASTRRQNSFPQNISAKFTMLLGNAQFWNWRCMSHFKRGSITTLTCNNTREASNSTQNY